LKESVEPGPIVDRRGNVLGSHKGIAFYTVGQRRGLGLAKGRPLYVIGIDRDRNALVVGEEKEVYAHTFTIDSVNWINMREIISSFSAQVKIRYNHQGSEAVVTPKGRDELEMSFKTPQKAITPGQAAVLYEEDRVLGGGWIREVMKS
jgi:tRNA-specific 2-thiouridylase